MNRARVVVVCVWVVLVTLAGPASAELVTIGTATYQGVEYNLIWNDASSGSSPIWLDYSHPEAYWANQLAWAAGLDGQLAYSIDPSYDVTWTDPAWRLPDAGSAPSYGCLAATQEMGLLYYDELGFFGGSSNDGVVSPDLAGSVFEHLELAGYWTSTEGDPLDLLGQVINSAWFFGIMETRNSPYNDTVYGFQDIDAISGSFFGVPLAVKHLGLAVRSAEVSPLAAVPEPASLLMLLSGLGAVGLLWRRRPTSAYRT